MPVFERLDSELGGRLVVAYGQAARNTYLCDGFSENVSFKTVRLKNIWFGGERAVWQNFWQVFRQYGIPNAVISEHGPRILSFYPLFVYCKSHRIPLILWGHGGSRKRSISESSAWKDKIHRLLIRKADAYICYTDGIKKELAKITEAGKLFVARNTLDADSLFKIRFELEKIGKQRVKNKLGLQCKHYLCFIGRLVSSKQMDYLIDVYEILRRSVPSVGLVIIGNGPEKKSLQNYANTKMLDSIAFVGEISDWEKSGEYLYACDIMVIPRSVGLSVNHAFCFGLPVLTQESTSEGPFHGPEIEYIVKGETGFVCEVGNREQMVERVKEIFAREAYFKNKVGAYCRENLRLETMINGMVSAINYALK